MAFSSTRTDIKIFFVLVESKYEVNDYSIDSDRWTLCVSHANCKQNLEVPDELNREQR